MSRARMNVENAFGILSSRFRIFKKSLTYAPENVDLFVLTARCLHNLLLKALDMKNTELETMTIEYFFIYYYTIFI